MKNKLKIFEEKKVRSVWSEEKQKWFFLSDRYRRNLDK